MYARLGRQVAEDAPSARFQVDALPGGQRFPELPRLRHQRVGQDERLELGVLEASLHLRLTLLQSSVRLALEEVLPIGIRNGFTRGAVGEDGEDGFGFAGVEAKLDGVIGLQSRGDGEDADKARNEPGSPGPLRFVLARRRRSETL